MMKVNVMNKFCGIYIEKINIVDDSIIKRDFMGMFNPYQVNKEYNDLLKRMIRNSLYELKEYEKFNIYVTEETLNGYYKCLYGSFI